MNFSIILVVIIIVIVVIFVGGEWSRRIGGGFGSKVTHYFWLDALRLHSHLEFQIIC